MKTSRRRVFLAASILAFGVVGWEHALHAFALGHGDTLAGHVSHFLQDGLLAVPLALLAVTTGLWLARCLRIAGHDWRGLVRRGALVSIAFTLLVIPAAAVHQMMHAVVSGQGAIPAPVGGVRGLLLHAVEDALLGQLIGLPLAVLGLALVGQPAAARLRSRRTRRLVWKLAPAAVLVLAVAVMAGVGRDWAARLAQATPTLAAEFDATDDPGPWFKCVAGGCVPAGTQSLAVVHPGDTIRIKMGGRTNTVHTFTSLLVPAGAGTPFDQPGAFKGIKDFTLPVAGLYVFVCKLHPFMLAAVIADDPGTDGLDLGENITLINGITVPTSSDLATRLLRAFFLITNPSNYQDHNPATNPALTWTIAYPAGVPIRITGGAVVDLKGTLEARYGNGLALAPIPPPAVPGVGEVWVDTEYELSAGKTKPGTATAVDVTRWTVTKKVALPEIDMNNPHNMWTDRDQTVIYQTQWFDNKLTVFDRVSGKLIRNIVVGDAPAHVMTRVNTDQVHVSINGEDAVVELNPATAGNTFNRTIPVQFFGQNPAQPHAHWMSADGNTMVTPNSNTNDSTAVDVSPPVTAILAKTPTGTLPIASGIAPDTSKYYVSNYLDSTITCISLGAPACKDGASTVATKTINLLLGGSGMANYDPIGGTGFTTSGALPIQTPVSPHGKYVVTANTLTGTITIIDTDTDTLVKVLSCDAGCHGVNFGAKKGGGYYAYVSSKFSNRLLVVDPDPNNDGNASDAAVVGSVVLVAGAGTRTDDAITADPAYAGMGGQGVLPIPLVYHGWVQNLPQSWKARLTPQQRQPIP